MATQFGNTDAAYKKGGGRAFVEDKIFQEKSPPGARGGAGGGAGGGGGGFLGGLQGALGAVGTGMELVEKGRVLKHNFEHGDDASNKAKSDDVYNKLKDADPEDVAAFSDEAAAQYAAQTGLPIEQVRNIMNAAKAFSSANKRQQVGTNAVRGALEDEAAARAGGQPAQGQVPPEQAGAPPPQTEEEILAIDAEAMGMSPEELGQIRRSLELEEKAKATPSDEAVAQGIAMATTGFSPKEIVNPEHEKAAVQGMKRIVEDSTKRMDLQSALIFNEVANGRTPAADTFVNLDMERRAFYGNTGEAVLNYAVTKMNIWGKYGDIIKSPEYTEHATEYMRGMVDPAYKEKLKKKGLWDTYAQVPEALPFQVWQTVQPVYQKIADAQKNSITTAEAAKTKRYVDLTTANAKIMEARANQGKNMVKLREIQKDLQNDTLNRLLDTEKHKLKSLEFIQGRREFAKQYNLDAATQSLAGITLKATILNDASVRQTATFSALADVFEDNKDDPLKKDIMELLKLTLPSARGAKNANAKSDPKTTQAYLDSAETQLGGVAGPGAVGVNRIAEAMKTRDYLVSSYNAMVKMAKNKEIMFDIRGQQVAIDVSQGLDQTLHNIMKHSARDMEEYGRLMSGVDEVIFDLGVNNSGMSHPRPKIWDSLSAKLKAKNGGMLPPMNPDMINGMLEGLQVDTHDWHGIQYAYKNQYDREQSFLLTQREAAEEKGLLDNVTQMQQLNVGALRGQSQPNR